MKGHWDRVKNDASEPLDEEAYGLLASMLFAESRVGYIAIYLCGGIPIIESSTRHGPGNSIQAGVANMDMGVDWKEVRDGGHSSYGSVDWGVAA